MQNRYVRVALVIAVSVLTGAFFFVGSFFAVDFIWTHFVITNRAEITAGDGIMVMTLGFLTGTVLGLGALSLMFYRFWPKKQN